MISVPTLKICLSKMGNANRKHEDYVYVKGEYQSICKTKSSLEM